MFVCVVSVFVPGVVTCVLWALPPPRWALVRLYAISVTRAGCRDAAAILSARAINTTNIYLLTFLNTYLCIRVYIVTRNDIHLIRRCNQTTPQGVQTPTKMKGRDITHTKQWATLSALGFTPIRFKGSMGYYEIGAALVRKGDGELITISPEHYRDMGNVWSFKVGGRSEAWKPQPLAPLSKYDTAGQAVYSGSTRYLPVDRPFGSYVKGRSIAKEAKRLISELVQPIANQL